MKKLQELLKALGLKSDVIKKYMESDEEKTKDLDPSKDSEEILSAIKDVLKNDIEPEIVKDANIKARAHIYGELEKDYMKKGGFKKEDLGIAEPKLEHYQAHYEKLQAEKTKGKGKETSEQITELQDKLVKSEAAKAELEAKIPQFEKERDEKIEEYKIGIKRENHYLTTISKFEEGTVVSADKALRLIADNLEKKYDVKFENDEYVPYEKNTPGKKVQKTASEFKKIEEILKEELEKEGLLKKSNGNPDPKKEVIDPGSKDKKKMAFPDSVYQTEKENAAMAK